MTEKQMETPEYSILVEKHNMLTNCIFKLNKKIFSTSNYEKRYKLINKLTEHTDELVKINCIADYLDRHKEVHNTPSEKIVELSRKLLEDERAYKKAFKIDRRRKIIDFEF